MSDKLGADLARPTIAQSISAQVFTQSVAALKWRERTSASMRNLQPTHFGQRSNDMTHELDAAIVVRAIGPSDAVNYRAILQRTSAEDRYCRFFHCIDHFTDKEIQRYIKARVDAIGLIAVKHGRPLGTVHAFFVEERCAELAIVVANDARRLGIGRRLLDEIRRALQRRGCTSIVAYALPQNSAFSNLARSIGMRPVSSDGGIISWSCALQTPMKSAFSDQGPWVRARNKAQYSTALVDASLFGCCNLLDFQHERSQRCWPFANRQQV